MFFIQRVSRFVKVNIYSTFKQSKVPKSQFHTDVFQIQFELH